jgi:hypothetical protein
MRQPTLPIPGWNRVLLVPDGEFACILAVQSREIAGWRMLYLHVAYAVTVHKLQGSQTEQAIVAG